MELVYLWVEDYKNIKKQGFNFSPRFECKFYDKYDENGKLKENCKLEIKPKEHIENFFGDNINVTAIVGKNGSGKSRILELITLFRFEKLKKELNSKNILMIFKNKNKFYIPYGYSSSFGGDSFKSFNINNITNDTNFIIHSDTNIYHDNLFWLTLFTNGLSDFTEGKKVLQGSSFESFYNGSDNYGNNEEYNFYKKFSFCLKDNANIFNILNEDFIFDSMYMEFDLKNLIPSIHSKNDEQLQRIESFFEKTIDNNFLVLGEETTVITIEVIIYTFLASYFLSKYINVILDSPYHLDSKKIKKDFLDDNIILPINVAIDLYNQKKVEDIKSPMKMTLLLLKGQYNKYKEIIYTFCKEEKGEIQHFEMNVKELEYINNYKEIIEYMISNYTLDSNSLILKSQVEESSQENTSKFYDLFSTNTFYEDLYRSGKFYLNYIHSKKNNMTFNSLSTGEKQLLKFITNFTYTLIDTKYDNRMIFLDEIETAFHPQWQKKFIDIIIKFINVIREKGLVPKSNIYHLIFVTHSSFILSDIPKENIIFLDKEKIGNCKVLSHDEVLLKKQTFGANIHTLLSDSFFMEDGLMGEFAKGKINDVYNFIVHHTNR